MGPVVVLFVLSWFYSNANGTEAEIWELQMTGDTRGTLKMALRRIEVGKDTYSIAGKFSGRIRDHESGPGLLRCKLKGKIEHRTLLADFTSYADTASYVRLHGTMKGNLSESQGFGTWSLTHSQGSRAGEWTMKRIKPTP